jgi:hypothetical protein
MSSPLAQAHIEAERRLREVTVAAVETIWSGLPGYDRENVDEWLSKVLPVVAAAQRQSVNLTDAYLARALDRRPVGAGADQALIAGVRAGTSPAQVYERPFVTLWSKLGKGEEFAAASTAARARAGGMAAFDVQASMRDTLQLVGREDDSIWGYQRVADPGACSFCLKVNGAQFRTADPMPLHNFCGCGVEPVVYTRGVDNRNALSAFNASPTPVPEGVAVHTHGEMGPVLADPAHHFTSESDL